MRKDADLTEQEIKEKVDRFFRRDSRIHDSRIRVDVEGRSVRLEGEVRNTQAFRAAENVAYTVMGVKTVVDILPSLK
jgi:osmotically-inducible protein OsmY